MHIKVTWDQEFYDLMMYLIAKYGRDFLTLDGIGDQMDINKFSKDFFNTNTTTADVSIDANANVCARTSIEYNHEMPKPIKKYNSYFLLWKQLKKDHGLLEANTLIEEVLRGDLYINDATDIAMPYSYHPSTTIIIKEKYSGISKHVTLNDMFNKHWESMVSKENYDEIDMRPFCIEVYEEERWVKLERIVRHTSHTDLMRFETKEGNTFVVTEDHPCILDDGDEKKAIEVKVGDKIKSIKSKCLNVNKNVRIEIDENKAYTIGSMIGDGSFKNNCCSFHQKKAMNSSYAKVFGSVYGSLKETQQGRGFDFGNSDLKKWFADAIGTNSMNRHLPENYLHWDVKGQESLLAGIVDTDGCVNKRSGVVNIRVSSFAVVQQVAELAKQLGFERVRTSLSYNYQKEKARIVQTQPLYRVSFVVNKESGIIEKSYKINANKDVIIRERHKDGRFETNEILKEDGVRYKGKLVYDITTSSGKFYTNGIIAHNCFNYSTYDVALEGLKGVSKRMKITKPKSLDTFVRQIEQFMVVAANSTLGATGFADFLIVASLFVDKIIETGYDGHIKVDDIDVYVREKLVNFIYTVNWEFRGGVQSPFTNLSIFDRSFLESLCSDYFLDGKCAEVCTVQRLQEIYVDAMNEELERTPLTFPVTTACFAIDDEKNILDKDFVWFIAEKNKKFGFINIYNGKKSTLSSCCRLRSDRVNEYFNSFGAGSTKIGSLGVVTANFPRLAMRADGNENVFMSGLEDAFFTAAKINDAKRKIVQRRIDLGAAPLYTHGYMDIKKQYSTFGVTGLYEAVSILGMDILTEEGQSFVERTLTKINDWIDIAQDMYKAPHNCEQVPAETSSVKLAKKDKVLGFDCGVPFYSNQFIPLVAKANMLDRLRLQGKFDNLFSGGAICHVNVGERIENAKNLEDLIFYAAKQGVVYWAVNYLLRTCANNHTWVGSEHCPVCGEEWEDEITRVVGFFTNVKNWNKVRREHDWPNRQFYKAGEMKCE